MAVPIIDLRAQYRPLGSEIRSAIKDVLDGMQLFLGENVQAFEREFAAYSGARFGIGVGSGTDALLVALRALGIGSGDEVITSSHTFVATAEAIALAGARPVFVDIDPETYALDPNKVESAINQRTRAIMPVHLYGHPADMDPLLDIARSRGLRVIEDVSQAHGAQYLGRRVGSIGDVGCFSFYYTKNLGAYGEAGMVVTSDDAIAEKARVIRDHGSASKYVHESVGLNSRLDEIQAAILRVKLPHLDEWNDSRRALAQMYHERLATLPVSLPAESPDVWHVFHLYVIRTPDRDSLQAWLQGRGIATRIHYPIPVHRQAAYRFCGSRPGTLPETEKAAQEILSLPMYPELEPAQVEEVASAIHEFFSGNGKRSSDTRVLQIESADSLRR